MNMSNINDVLSGRVKTRVEIDGVELELVKFNFRVLSELESKGITLESMNNLNFTQVLDVCWELLTSESKNSCENSKGKFLELITFENVHDLTSALSKSLEASFPDSGKNAAAPAKKQK